MTDSNPLQEANSIKSLSPKGASLLKLCQSSFANLQLTFVFLSLVDVPSAFQFTPLLTSIDYQVQNMTSSPWKSVCGTISLQETNWSLSRRRSVQTNQWQWMMNGRPFDQSGKYTYPIQVKSAKTWKGPEKGGRSSEIRPTDMGLLLRTCADYLHDSWENITLYSWGYSHIGQRMHVYIFR